MRNSLKAAVALVALLAVHVSSARAQTTGQINALAEVLAAVTVTGTDLDFGRVAPTQTKVVAPAAGGQFTVTGSPSAPVLVSFGLPTDLGNAAVAVGSWTGLSNTTNTTTGATTITPSGAQQALTLSGTGELYLWIGGTLTTTGAPVGNYSNQVSLTVVYN